MSSSRYLAAIAELADAIVDMPLDKLSPFHRDLDAAIKQRDIADANQIEASWKKFSTTRRSISVVILAMRGRQGGRLSGNDVRRLSTA